MKHSPHRKPTVQSFIDDKIIPQTGEGGRFENEAHFELTRQTAAQIYQIDPDVLAHPNNHALNLRASQVLGALMGLTNSEFMQFRKHIETFGKTPSDNDRGNTYGDRIEPYKLAQEINTLIENCRGKSSAVLHNEPTVNSEDQVKPSSLPSTNSSQNNGRPHHNSRAPVVPSLNNEQFTKYFDELYETAMTHLPYGDGRTWVLTKFFDDLKNLKGINGQKALAEDIAPQFGKSLTIAINNAIDNKMLSQKEFDIETMNELNKKRAGISNEDYAKAIAHYAFPEDEARRGQCEEFLSPTKFLVPDKVASAHKSAAMKKARQERGDDWGTRAREDSRRARAERRNTERGA